MLDHFNEEQLISDIRKWILTAPGKEYILYYIRHLPEENRPHFMEGTRSALNTLLSEKKSYFRQARAAWFVENLRESIQYEYINYLILYNVQSVLQRLREQYPNCPVSALPGDINSWAIHYAARWDAIFWAASGVNSLNHLVYAQSLSRLGKDSVYLRDLASGLEMMTLRCVRYIEADDLPQPSELEEERQLLLELGIFPKEYVEYILNPISLLEKSILYDRLLTVAILFSSLDTDTIKDANRMADLLWELLRQMEEEEVLFRQDGEFLQSEPINQFYGKLYDYLSRLWTIDNIWKGFVSGPVVQYWATLNEPQKAVFRDVYYQFLKNSTVIATLLSPLDSTVIVDRLRRIGAIGLINSETSKILAEVEEPKKILVGRFLEMFRIINQQIK